MCKNLQVNNEPRDKLYVVWQLVNIININLLLKRFIDQMLQRTFKIKGSLSGSVLNHKTSFFRFLTCDLSRN